MPMFLLLITVREEVSLLARTNQRFFLWPQVLLFKRCVILAALDSTRMPDLTSDSRECLKYYQLSGFDPTRLVISSAARKNSIGWKFGADKVFAGGRGEGGATAVTLIVVVKQDAGWVVV